VDTCSVVPQHTFGWFGFVPCSPGCLCIQLTNEPFTLKHVAYVQVPTSFALTQFWYEGGSGLLAVSLFMDHC